MQELWVIYADDEHDQKPSRERLTDKAVLKDRAAVTVFDELYAAGAVFGRKLDVMWIYALDTPSKEVTRMAHRRHIPPDLKAIDAGAAFTNQVGRITSRTKLYRWE